jgi:hypothetical protein
MATFNALTSDSKVHFGEALDIVRPKLDKLTSAELLPMNVEPIVAASTVQGVFVRLSHLREQMAELPRFDVENFDLLDTYAVALLEANAYFTIASAPTEELAKVAALAKEQKEVFLCDVNVLIKRGYVRVKEFKPVRGRPSYRNLVSDLLALTTILRNHVNSGTNHSAVSIKELNHAEALSLRLMALTAARKRTPEALAKATLERQKAFTLMSRAYDQVRKAVHFLRWEKEDYAKMAPALPRGRKRVRKKRVVAAPVSSGVPEMSTPPSKSEAVDSKALTPPVVAPNDNDPFLH